jgi:hypothetical protein
MNSLALKKQKKFVSWCIPTMLSILSFSFIYGWSILNPKNNMWLEGGQNQDPMQAYVGWEFFRREPWSMPLGANRSFGMLPSNSVVYSDSIPLLAIFFKLFRNFMGPTFQFFGLWLFAVVLMQVCVSWLLAGLLTKSLITKTAFATLLLFSPIMLWRTTTHLALSGHFLILIALFLYFKGVKVSEFATARWLILLIVGLGIHGYLFLMIFLLYISDSVRAYMGRVLKPKEFGQVFAFTIIALVIIGKYFYGYSVGSPSNIKTAFWGVYSFNLLSIFNPSGWSTIFSWLPTIYGGAETFTYLGVGTILLLFMTLAVSIRNYRKIQLKLDPYLPLLFTIALLSAFAITNQVRIGRVKLDLPLSSFLVETFSMFRASARFIWPALYLLTILFLVLLLRQFKEKSVAVILSICAILQVVDTRAGWQQIKSFYRIGQVSELSPQSHSVYDAFRTNKYIRIMSLEGELGPVGWATVGKIAYQNGLVTNIAYLARRDETEFQDLQREIKAELSSGALDANTIYMLSGIDKEIRKKLLSDDRHNILIIDGLEFLFPYKD